MNEGSCWLSDTFILILKSTFYDSFMLPHLGPICTMIPLPLTICSSRLPRPLMIKTGVVFSPPISWLHEQPKKQSKTACVFCKHPLKTSPLLSYFLSLSPFNHAPLLRHSGNARACLVLLCEWHLTHTTWQGTIWSFLSLFSVLYLKKRGDNISPNVATGGGSSLEGFNRSWIYWLLTIC